MKTLKISEIVQESESELGIFEKGGVTIAAGEDLFIHHITKKQKTELIQVKTFCKVESWSPVLYQNRRGIPE
jgi:hypothetical protein